MKLRYPTIRALSLMLLENRIDDDIYWFQTILSHVINEHVGHLLEKLRIKPSLAVLGLGVVSGGILWQFWQMFIITHAHILPGTW